MNKPIFIVMVGLPGAGKSTAAKTYMYPIFSSDEYRERLLGDVNDQTKNDIVFRALHKDIRDCLLCGNSCILDATNMSRKARKRALEAAKGIACTKIAHVVCPPWFKVVLQNGKRERVVPIEVLEKMIRQFEFPQPFEGFDNIVVDNQYEDTYGQTLMNMFKHMSGFNQHNPHHIYDLAGHCIRVASKFPSCDIRSEAGYFHDIAKLYTQKFDDKGIAHYYNHDNIGAYIVASYTDWKSIASNRDLERIFYINYHMRAHNDFCTSKAERKYRQLFGDDRFDKLMEFAEADRLASGTYEEKKDDRPGTD